MIATLIREKFYTRNSIHNTFIKDSYKKDFQIEYILGLFNSSLINFYYLTQTQESGKVLPQVHIEDLRSLPIKTVSHEDQKLISNLVEKVMLLSIGLLDNSREKEIENLIKEIDVLVYNLYGLTPEEIRIVGGFNNKSKKAI